MNIGVKYMGLQLCSPVVIASSPFTTTVEKLVKCQENGAGAVVLKSIFEEQIAGEAAFLERYNDYPEAADYLRGYVKDEYLRGHLNLIEEAKKRLCIPVIASINCHATGSWVDYARSIEQAGADAIELNIFILPTDAELPSEVIEQRYLEIAAAVSGAVTIPVSVKLGVRFTNVLHLVRELYNHGVRGVVLFNRFFEPDIDTDTVTLTNSDGRSSRSELRNNLRTVGICSARIPQMDIAVSTGVHTGDDVVKCLLAGAKVAEVCSALYDGGLEVIGQMNRHVGQWMETHTFDNVDAFTGILAYDSAGNDELYTRAQYMRFFPK